MHYFIITHNLNLLTKYNIPEENQSVVLVGDHKDEHINVNTIICNKLLDNIENYPYLCSYTGWYSVSKNKLHEAHSVVSLLEYDIITSQDLHYHNLKIINEQKGDGYIVAYNKTLTDHYVFYKSTPWLEISLQRIYGIDLLDFVTTYKARYPFWPTATNITMSSKILSAFTEWFDPMTKIFSHDPLGAYVHERAFFIFCVLNNIDILYAPNEILYHKQTGSHTIDDIYGRILKQYNTRCLTNHLISEYDTIYQQEYSRCIGDS